MALTLNDVVESRQYQRTPRVRRDLVDTHEAAQSRRERFSVEAADQRRTTRAEPQASASTRIDVARSRAERPSPLGVTPPGLDDVKQTAAKTDRVQSDAERSAVAHRSEVRSAPDAAKHEPKPAEPDPTKPGPTKPSTAETDKVASDTDETEISKPQGRAERSEASVKPAPANLLVANPTGDTTAKTAVPEQGAFPTAKGEMAEATTASGKPAEDEATVAGAGNEAPATAIPMMAVFAVPLAPILPLVRGISATNPSGSDGDTEIDAAGPATAAASGLGAVTATTRGAATAKPAFDAALTEVAPKGTSDDAGSPMMTQGAEASGGAPAAPSSSIEAKATAAAQPSAAPPPATAPVPLGAVPMTIGLRALGASSRFEIRLDPKELGRIDVSIDIDKDKGTVGARLVVDRPETLALLQRDASALQQALAQTGLDASAAISLSLRSDQGQGQRNGQEAGADGQPGSDRSDRSAPQAGSDPASIDLAPLRMLRGLGHIDIRI